MIEVQEGRKDQKVLSCTLACLSNQPQHFLFWFCQYLSVEDFKQLVQFN